MNIKLKSIILSPFSLLYRIAPETEQKIMFRIKMGYKLDVDSPKTYNEKINWLKMYYRNDLIPLCADKYTARKYIEEQGFGSYLTKMYWHGYDPEDIPFDDMPDSFIIKVTSGSGNNVIVEDKNEIDVNRVKKQLSKWLKKKYLPAYGEWHYGVIKPSIIIEELLSDGAHYVPEDYKFFVFNNIEKNKCRVGCVALDEGRFIEHKRNVYDRDFNIMRDVQIAFKRNPSYLAEKPECFDEMCAVAEKLGEPFAHCRIDFFVIGNRFYVGEMTFYNGAGYDLVTPYEYNLKMGSWIELPDISKG